MAMSPIRDGIVICRQTNQKKLTTRPVSDLCSIPLVYRDGQMVYSQCQMYSRNYTEIQQTLNSMDTQALLDNNGDSHLEAVDYTARNYEVIPCRSGWMYDRTMFPNTVVMEVFRYLCSALTICPFSSDMWRNCFSGIWCAIKISTQHCRWLCSALAAWSETICMGSCRITGDVAHHSLSIYSWRSLRARSAQ